MTAPPRSDLQPTATRRDLWTLVPSVLAGVGAVAVIGVTLFQLLSLSPPRDVTFDGGWQQQPSCFGPDLWTGRVAYSVCDWAYRRRALVRFDPKTAVATVLHRWERDDGNVPKLRIVRPCRGGRLFVVEETRTTTLVRVDGDHVSADAVDIPGERVLGARCDGVSTELFVGAEPYTFSSKDSLARVDDGNVTTVHTYAFGDTPGRIIGAWFVDGAWSALALERRDSYPGTPDAVVAGPLGGDFTTVASADPEMHSPCVEGAPGGWLFDCTSRTWVTTRDGALRVVVTDFEAEMTVLYEDGSEIGFTVPGDDPRFGGLGDQDFELVTLGDVLDARRATDRSVSIAAVGFVGFDLGVRALPMANGRVALWGELGRSVVTLGPSLAREDALGPFERLARPIGRFRASSMSTLDQLGYVAVLLAALGWLPLAVVTWVRRIRKRPNQSTKWMRVVAWTHLAVLLLGAVGFWHVVLWI